MKKALGVVAVVIGLLASPFISVVGVSAASDSVLIVAIQPGSKTSASEEYIQIHNMTDVYLDITGWRLEYFAAAPKNFLSPVRTIALNGLIPAKGDYLAASTNYKTEVADVSFSPTMAASGGHMRLVGGSATTPTIYDIVGWGTAANPAGQSTQAPSPGVAILRKSENATYINSGNNALDFTVGDASMVDVESITNTAPLQITELLPNPASPTSDSVGEFIELYNPGSAKVALAGYTLLTGATLNHKYVFKDQSIEPESYKAFYVSETKVTLSNSGGKAQLLFPGGDVANESANYGNAPDGSAWAWDGVNWQWTTTPSPDQSNIFASAAIPVAPTKSTKTTSKKKTVIKAKKSSGKVKGASTSTSAPSSSRKADDQAQSMVHVGVLAGVGGLALLYGIYEYRQDIANAYRKFRSNRGNRA